MSEEQDATSKDPRSKEPVLKWLPNELAESEAQGRVEMELEDQPSLSTAEFDERVQDELSKVYECSGYLADEWESLCENLTSLMNEVNPDDDLWCARMDNFGWRQLSGAKNFCASSGTEFLREVLPQTDCHFKIYHPDGYIVVNNAHHDSPCWKEMYYIYPAGECEECGEVFPMSGLTDRVGILLCPDCLSALVDAK